MLNCAQPPARRWYPCARYLCIRHFRGTFYPAGGFTQMKALSFLAALLLTVPAAPSVAQQTASSSSTHASQLLQQSLAALQGNTSLSDVTLSGPARRIAGSDDESGTATYKAIPGANRLDLSLSGGARSEIVNLTAAPPLGAWSGPDGVSHSMPLHNLMNQAGISPAFPLHSNFPKWLPRPPRLSSTSRNWTFFSTPRPFFRSRSISAPTPTTTRASIFRSNSSFRTTAPSMARKSLSTLRNSSTTASSSTSSSKPLL